MTHSSTGPIREPLSRFLFFLAILIALAGIAAFYFMSSKTFLLRGAVFLIAIAFSGFIASFSLIGKMFIAFARDSIQEVRKIVWPSRGEAVQSTLVVFGFVSIMALYLCLTDKLVGWFVFSFVLGWR